MRSTNYDVERDNQIGIKLVGETVDPKRYNKIYVQKIKDEYQKYKTKSASTRATDRPRTYNGMAIVEMNTYRR